MEKRKGGERRREAPPGRRRKKRLRESHRERGEEKRGRRWEGHEGDFGSENYDIMEIAKINLSRLLRLPFPETIRPGQYFGRIIQSLNIPTKNFSAILRNNLETMADLRWTC